jgi:hypothetical protein
VWDGEDLAAPQLCVGQQIMKKEDIANSIHNPSKLEELYRQYPNEFVDAFTDIYEENQDSLVLKVWQERLFYSGPKSNTKETHKQLILTILLAVITGLIVRIPQFIPLVEGEWFYPRYPVILTLSAVSVYFLFKNYLSKQIKKFVLLSTAVIFLSVGALAFPDKSDTFVLSCLHFPLVAWSLFGIAFTGDGWKSTQKRIDFLRFNGELIIFTTLILIGGMVLTGITFALFNLIDVKIENWYMENIVVMGLVASPIVATYIIDSAIGMKTKIASIIAKIFMPLFLVTVILYLSAMIFEQKSPYSDRDFLIVFNALLLLVLAISVFSIIEKKFHESSKIFEVTNIALVVTTLVIDMVALSAILFRLTEFGITPNRIVVFGANLLIFVHLCGFLKPYIEIARKNKDYSAVEKWTADYLPIYSSWSLIVAIGFPILFGFK